MVSFKKIEGLDLASATADEVVSGLGVWMASKEVESLKKFANGNDRIHKQACQFVALTSDYQSPLVAAYPRSPEQRKFVAYRMVGLKPMVSDDGHAVLEKKYLDIFVLNEPTYIRKLQFSYVKYTNNLAFLCYLGAEKTLEQNVEAQMMDVFMDTHRDTGMITLESLQLLEKKNKIVNSVILEEITRLEGILRGSPDLNTVLPGISKESFNDFKNAFADETAIATNGRIRRTRDAYSE